ncbi:alpha/beta fold hydrolase [Arthrobacter sp. W4I7]|uniref:alpha/beta fold hydrolase n=1 Tax=Arthrobacter sp. W4I7 TaxID=3042296 RepID=UPI00278719F5|nr:alpha/beta hydrolase [Arthrobacter sp. W4I7]MDQ0691326.1 pimeloyl-ACP methyl ester carboxylesterase [Arthrobacter sp. W4I7]
MTAPAAPQWLADSLAVAPTSHDLEAGDLRIRYYDWGPIDAPGVVLIHGGLCHARWWDHIAPLLTGHRVLAVDLSGHGDSGRRESYDAHRWAQEVLAVVKGSGLSRPVLVGHSMGGQVAAAAAAAAPTEIGGVITIDTRFNDQPYTHRNKPSKAFKSLDQGIAEFVPVHAALGGAVDPLLIRHIAESSLTTNGDSWRWKRADKYAIAHVPLRSLLPYVHAPLAIIRTEHGLVTRDMSDEMRRLVPAPTAELELPGAGHNPMLEQPLALVTALRTLLSAWLPTVTVQATPPLNDESSSRVQH